MVKIIKPETISFTASVTEDEIRERMKLEVLEQIGALDDDGKPFRGITCTIRRGESRKGGYTITISGPAPARIMLPRQGE